MNLIDEVKDISNTQKISDSFAYHFLNAGFLFGTSLSTKKVFADYEGKQTVLGDILDKSPCSSNCLVISSAASFSFPIALRYLAFSKFIVFQAIAWY